MRSLIIEKDLAKRVAIESKLAPFGECHTAGDRDAALALFRESIDNRQPFDLVTINVDMADMQEALIISKIRTIEDELAVPPDKRSCLIAISKQQNRQLVTDCMIRGCDDFFKKCLDTQQLLETLLKHGLATPQKTSAGDPAKAFDGRKLVEKITRSINSGRVELPPAPRVAMRVRQLVGSGAEMDAIVDLLRQDLSISTRLISVSNSVAYGGVIKNTDINQAVSRLGLDRTVEVVMSICCRGYFVTNHPAYKQRVEDLWWHSLACAHVAEMIVQEKGHKIQDDLFSLALLHDVGKLVLIQAAGEMQKPKKYQLDIDFDELETTIEEHHARFGVMLLQKWGYSKDFSAMILHHRSNGNNPVPLMVQVLHQADLMVALAGFGDGRNEPNEVVEKLGELGFTEQQQKDLTERIRERIQQLRYLF